MYVHIALLIMYAYVALPLRECCYDKFAFSSSVYFKLKCVVSVMERMGGEGGREGGEGGRGGREDLLLCVIPSCG